MDTKAFEEKVANILLKWTKVSEDKTHVRGRSDAIDDIMKSIIEPLLELVKAYEELVKEKDFIDKHRNHYYAIQGAIEKCSKLRQRINELRKQIEE